MKTSSTKNSSRFKILLIIAVAAVTCTALYGASMLASSTVSPRTQITNGALYARLSDAEIEKKSAEISKSFSKASKEELQAIRRKAEEDSAKREKFFKELPSKSYSLQFSELKKPQIPHYHASDLVTVLKLKNTSFVTSISVAKKSGEIIIPLTLATANPPWSPYPGVEKVYRNRSYWKSGNVPVIAQYVAFQAYRTRGLNSKDIQIKGVYR